MSKNTSHSFDGVLLKHRYVAQYCTKCGLIMLKNDASRKAINKPCPGKDE